MTALVDILAEHASVVGLTFDATVSWPFYDWMGVAKAGLESANRYLARYLGPKGVRCNLVSAGPLDTMAKTAIPGADAFNDVWGACPAWLGHQGHHARGQGNCCPLVRLVPSHYRRDNPRRWRYGFDRSLIHLGQWPRRGCGNSRRRRCAVGAAPFLVSVLRRR